MIPFLKKQLVPNRLAVYITALLALLSGIEAVAGDLDFSSTVGLLGSVAVIGGVVVKWLGGWQQYESALLQRDLITFQASTQADLQDRAVQAQQAVSKPGTGPKVTLPR